MEINPIPSPGPKEEPKREKVASGAVVVKKKSGFDKFKDSFIVSDLGSVAENIVSEVVVPQLQNFIMDSINDGLSMLFTGSKATKRYSGSGSSAISRVSYVDYSRPSARQAASRPREEAEPYDLENIIFATKADADMVREALISDIEQYGAVSAVSLYDFAGVDKKVPYTLEHYGWKADSIRGMDIVRVRDGWWLRMPRMVLI